MRTSHAPGGQQPPKRLQASFEVPIKLWMSPRPRAWPWYLFVAVALGATIYLVRPHGSADRGAASAEGSPPQSVRAAPGPVAAKIPLPQGSWRATGQVVRVPPNTSSNQPPGTVLKRPWAFHRSCPRCQIVFSRLTLYGPSATKLVKHGRYFTAKFPPVKVPCSYPRGSSYRRRPSGQSHDYYRLWMAADGASIHATEWRSQTGCYRTPDPPDVTRWHATRARLPIPGYQPPS